MADVVDLLARQMAAREQQLRDAIEDRDALLTQQPERFERENPGYRIGATRCTVDGSPLLIVRTPTGDTLDLSDVVAHIESLRQ